MLHIAIIVIIKIVINYCKNYKNLLVYNQQNNNTDFKKIEQISKNL